MSFDKGLLARHLIIIFFMFGFQFLPPVGQITPLGMNLLGIFIGALYGWLTIGFAFPSIAGLLALGLSGAYPNFGAMLAATFGGHAAVMMVGCLFICAFIEVIDLPNVIIGFMLNLKWVRKSINVFMIIFFITTYLVSAVSNANLAAYVFVEMYRALARQTGISPTSKLNTYMMIGITFSAILAEISFPFKPIAVLVVGLCQSTAGITLSFTDYLLFITGYQLASVILFVLIGRYVLRIDFSQISKVQVPVIPASTKQKVGLWCVLILIVAFILSNIGVPVFHQLGIGGVSLLVLLLMMFIQVDGAPLVDLKALSGHFSWGMYLLMVFLIPFSGFIGGPAAGIAATMKSLVTPVLTMVPPAAFLILAMVFTTLITNFLNNMPVAVIFISLMGTLQSSLTGINFGASCVAIVMCAFISMATPAANSAAVYVYGNRDLAPSLRSILGMGSIFCVILCALTIFCYYPLVARLI